MFNHTVEEAVLEALADSRYDYRTVSGIVNETGLTPTEVQNCLDRLKGKVTKGLIFKNGEPTYALKSRKGPFRMAWDFFLATR